MSPQKPQPPYFSSALIPVVPSRELASHLLPHRRHAGCHPDSSTLLSLESSDLNSRSLLWACRPSAAQWTVHRLPSEFFHATPSSLDEVGVLTSVASLGGKSFCLLLHLLSDLLIAFLWWDSRPISWRYYRCASPHYGALWVIPVEAVHITWPASAVDRVTPPSPLLSNVVDVMPFLFGSFRVLRRW
jgi:hypothetical protein